MEHNKFFLLRNSCWSNKTKYLCQGAQLTILTLSAITSSCAQPNSSSESYWSNIRLRDAKIQAAKIEWKVSSTWLPRSILDTEEATIEKIESEGEVNQLPQAEIESNVKAAKFDFLWMKHGSTSIGNLTCVRVGNEMRCDRISTPMNVPGQTPDLRKSHSVDYFDGTNSVSMNAGGVEVPSMGQVGMEGEPVMRTSAPESERRALILAAPISTIFSEKSTTLTEGDNDTLILETPQEELGFKFLVRATIDKKLWCIKSIESVTTRSRKVIKEYTATDFRSFGDDIWLPTHVKVITPKVQVDDYVLQKLTLNEKVRAADVKITHAPGIVDCRFGECVTYKWQSGVIPERDKVEKIQRGETGPPPGANTPGANIPMTVPILATFLCFLGGGMLITDGRQKKKKDDDN